MFAANVTVYPTCDRLVSAITSAFAMADTFAETAHDDVERVFTTEYMHVTSRMMGDDLAIVVNARHFLDNKDMWQEFAFELYHAVTGHDGHNYQADDCHLTIVW